MDLVIMLLGSLGIWSLPRRRILGLFQKLVSKLWVESTFGTSQWIRFSIARMALVKPKVCTVTGVTTHQKSMTPAAGKARTTLAEMPNTAVLIYVITQSAHTLNKSTRTRHWVGPRWGTLTRPMRILSSKDMVQKSPCFHKEAGWWAWEHRSKKCHRAFSENQHLET